MRRPRTHPSTSGRVTARRNAVIPRQLFSIGEVVAGHYEIRALLGSGGMGQVFEAHDRDLNRRVAIKAHWPHMRAFSIRKEAQALAAIRNEAVPTVHGIELHDGVELLVMERIWGMTLAEHVAQARARGGLSIGEIVEVLRRLADALAAVHDAGIAHRDVKPANVMLAPRRLVLTDFGVFLPEFEETEGSPGTLEYMAPEALARRVARGDAHRLDIYALGVVAYELLTGARPFDASSRSDLVLRQLREPPPSVATKRADVPPRLVMLVDAMLSREPADRPPSMDAVAGALRTVFDDRTSMTRPISVLVVDDDRACADVLESFVREVAPDASVRVARDAETALAHLRQAPPELLLLDLGLPGMNGVELCMYLRGSNVAPQTKVVALSAAAQPRDVTLLRQLGFGSFVRKGSDWLDRVEESIREVREWPRNMRGVT